MTPGDRLGPYTLISPVGEGGMGEVWKARDTRLDRTVAIKVSKADFSERFEREARAVAALNHPNICTLHDVGPNYLVMELVEGVPLKGPLPVEKAVEYAGQILDALDAAHRKGITHRDLKPANILVTKQGIKLLDFGLAKQTAPLKESDATLTAALTGKGQIVGTLQYMSPEQLQAKEADARSDMFSFGCVLYEMLTGKRAFAGENAASVIAAILEREPAPLQATPPLERVVRKCLAKDPDERFQAARDLKYNLALAMEPNPPGSRSRPWPWVAAAALVIGILGGWGVSSFRQQPPVRQSLRFQILPPGAAELLRHPALSPDGRTLAFVRIDGGSSRVWLRALDTLESRPLAGTESTGFLFWSPDSKYLGFFAQGKLKKIAVAGGPAQTLCDADFGRGGTWNRDGVILLSASENSPILRVSSAGGDPVPVTKLPEGDSNAGHRFPAFLPDGVHFLFSAASAKAETTGFWVGSLHGSAPQRLLPDLTNGLYAPPTVRGGAGHLLFMQEGTLMAQPFDPKSLKFSGERFPVAEQVYDLNIGGFGDISISENGMLAYAAGSDTNRELVWMDRAGKRLGTVGKPGGYGEMALSPDEKTVAVSITNGAQSDIWLLDVTRGVASRFTFLPGKSRLPLWSPDGTHVAFSRSGQASWGSDIYQKPAGGNGREELLLRSGVIVGATDWSPDGKWLVCNARGQETAFDLSLLPLSGERKPVPYLQTPFAQRFGRFSPDGKLLAYQSDESGQHQVYVSAVPLTGAKYQISAAGGIAPQWRRDGRELYYISADLKLMAVPVKLGSTLEPGAPQSLFSVVGGDPIGGSNFVYAPSRDGQRFLVNFPAGGEGASGAQPITVVTNWQAGLKK